ncbi:MAG: DUF805 domain-containing protein [Bacteroidota bacterium]
MNWYIEVLKKYAVFTGRARRSEYWYFVLFNFLNSLMFGLIDRTFGTFDPDTGYGTFEIIYAFAVLIPGIAVAVRRMHDVGKNGWYVLIPIYNIVLAATPGIIGENEYGADPKNTDLNTTKNFR